MFTDSIATDCLKYIVRRRNSFAFNYITTQDVGKQLKLVSTAKAVVLMGYMLNYSKKLRRLLLGHLLIILICRLNPD